MTYRRTLSMVVASALLAITGAGVSLPANATTPVTIKVDAASSLTQAFTAIANRYMTRHPNVTIQLTFDSSSALANRILNGDGADVFASASMTNMKTVINGIDSSGLASKATTYKLFASNRVVVAVPKSGSPVTSLRSLSTPKGQGVSWIRCVDSAPCGTVAAAALACAQITRAADATFSNDSLQVAQLRLGQADAGIIYHSDVVATKDSVSGKRLFREIAFPKKCRAAATTRYPIAVMTDSSHPAAAADFVKYVRSHSGRLLLNSFGFRKPNA